MQRIATSKPRTGPRHCYDTSDRLKCRNCICDIVFSSDSKPWRFNMFGSMKDQVLKDAVFTERLRTIFFLSKIQQRPISVLLQKPTDRLSDAKVRYGVVDFLGVNKDPAKPIHERHTGGSFTLSEDQSVDSAYDFNLVTGVSLEFFTDPVGMAQSKSSLNCIQHLKPFTGFGDHTSESSESFYYYFLTRMIKDRT